MLKIIMLAPVNFLRSYSGFQYLADFLYKKGFQIEIYAHIPKSQIKEAEKLQYPVYSCYSGFFGDIPKIRHLFFKKQIRNALKKCDAVILNSTSPVGYFQECVEFKNNFPNKIFIQYCSEFWMPNEKSIYSKIEKDYFKLNANVSDLIIDVEPNRAFYRKKYFNIEKNIEVIPNTLPRGIFQENKKEFSFDKDFNITIKKHQKLILYTGQISKTSLIDIITIIKNTNKNIVLIWFAHGTKDLIKNARRQVSQIIKESEIYICNPIPRNKLISIMSLADLGLINYAYSHTTNLNLKYAAPTKLYEYISNGLPIVSYGNPSIKKIVDEFKLGVCSPDDNPESLGKTINEFIIKNDFSLYKKHVKNVFNNELCYEKSAKKSLDKIIFVLLNSKPKKK